MKPCSVRLLLLLFFCSLPAVLPAEELRPDYPSLLKGPMPFEAMLGESFSYDIAFLWFDRLAEGRLVFSTEQPPNTYRAVLEARTLGLAAWLTRDRVQRYVSVMEMAPDGQMRSLSHESRIIKGQGENRKDRIKRYTFDYQKRQVRYQRARDGKFYKEEMLPMGEDEFPNDILTAFYNFRAGVFGPFKAGARYTIPKFGRKGTLEIVVEILPAEKWRGHPFFPPGGLLCRISVDPDVFDTEGGQVYVWFDDFGRPARGIVENVIGLGDVRGTLRK